MPRGRKQPDLKQAVLTPQDMQSAIQRIEKRIADIDAFDVRSVQTRSDPRIDALSNKLDALLVAIFGSGTIEYERYRWHVTNLDTAPINLVYPTPLSEVHEGLARGLASAKAQLETIKIGFQEELEYSVDPSTHRDQPEIERDNSLVHPRIAELCRDLLEHGAYAEAVERSFKIVRDRLRHLTGYETGSDAFGKGRLHIKGAAAAHVDSDFNQAVKFLTMAIDMFRNEKSHTSEGNIENANHALQYLVLSSLALRFLDRAEIIK